MNRSKYFILLISFLVYGASFAAQNKCVELLHGKLNSASAVAKAYKIPSNIKVIVAANRLPVVVTENFGTFRFQNAGGGLVSALKSVESDFDWLGWPGQSYREGVQPRVSKEISDRSNSRQTAIHISENEQVGFYEGFSNSVLWPIFHNLPHWQVKKVVGWDDYVRVNERFADEIVKKAKQRVQESKNNEKVVIWVHDYQLILVPGLVKKRLVDTGVSDRVKIGFFLHIPFPRDAQFSIIPKEIRRALLENVIQADQISFHTHKYKEAFLEVLKANDVLSDQIRSKIKVHPIGINPDVYRNISQKAQTRSRIDELKARYAGYKVILGLERLDPIKGIYQKLQAFDLFLRQNPEARGKTLLVQVAQPSRLGIPEYEALRSQLIEYAKQINSQYSIPGRLEPVQFLDHGLDTTDVVAGYHVADLTMVTSLRDGMNLVGLESVAVQKGRENPGVLILSQETGAASWLKGSLIVNPLNIQQMANSIKQGLSMSVEEKRARVELNLRHVDTNTADGWVSNFINDLVR